MHVKRRVCFLPYSLLLYTVISCLLVEPSCIPHCLTLPFFLSVSLVNWERIRGELTFHQYLPEKQKQPLSMEWPTSILHPPFSLLFFYFTSSLHPFLSQSALYPICPVLCNPPWSLLHKLPVIDPGHIAHVFPPVCLLEPQHPGPGLNEAPTKAHWWEAQCERGWPQPRAPRAGHQLPRALPPHKEVHCGQRPERAQRKGGRERTGKKREEISCSNNLENVR